MARPPNPTHQLERGEMAAFADDRGDEVLVLLGFGFECNNFSLMAELSALRAAIVVVLAVLVILRDLTSASRALLRCRRYCNCRSRPISVFSESMI